MARPKNMENLFKQTPFKNNSFAKKGDSGYDNPRENIDSHIKTKVISTKEIASGAEVLGDLRIRGNLSGGNIIAKSISGASLHSASTLQVSGSNLFLGGDGKLGVGNASPTYKLHVGNGLTDGQIAIDAAAANQSSLIFRKGAVSKWTLYIPENSNDLRIYDTTDRVNFASGGNVGIGTTSPSDLLEINDGKIRITGTNKGLNIYAGATHRATLEDQGTQIAIGSIADLPIVIAQNNGTGIYIDTSKRVGINTATPGALLDIRHSTVGSNDARLLELSQAGNDDYIFAGNDTLNFLELKTTTKSPIIVFERGGKIGVGTNTPTHLFSVSGGAVFLRNTTNPTTPISGACIFASGGALFAKGEAGTLTLIAAR